MLRMADSPTTRVRRATNLEGWVFGIVERRTGPVSHDLHGWIDAILMAGDGCDVGEGDPTLWGLQITSASNRSSRRKKMRANHLLPFWLADGTRGAALVTTGTRKRGGKPVPMIRWTTFTLTPGGELLEDDRWIEG